MGYKSEIVRDYFLNFYAMHSDVTVDLKSNSVDVHSVDHSCDWKVTLAYTGELTRSEEHTSELQSQSNLVCRLLLEKKKKHILTWLMVSARLLLLLVSGLRSRVWSVAVLSCVA